MASYLVIVIGKAEWTISEVGILAITSWHITPHQGNGYHQENDSLIERNRLVRWHDFCGTYKTLQLSLDKCATISSFCCLEPLNCSVTLKKPRLGSKFNLTYPVKQCPLVLFLLFIQFLLHWSICRLATITKRLHFFASSFLLRHQYFLYF